MAMHPLIKVSVSWVGLTGAVSLVIWAVSAAVGIHVEGVALLQFFVVVLVAGCAAHLLVRRKPNVWLESGVAASYATIVLWAGMTATGLDVGIGPYVVLFASTFVVNVVLGRKKFRVVRRTGANAASD